MNLVFVLLSLALVTSFAPSPASTSGRSAEAVAFPDSLRSDSARAVAGDDSASGRRGRRPRRPEYLGEVLRQRGNVVERWPDRTRNPIRVWVQPAPARRLAGWNPAFPASVRSAFQEWDRVGLPVHFAFVADSSRADVQVRWLSRFSTDESGRTVWWSNSRSLITEAEITLATHASDGGPQDPKSLRAVALHEIGHLLGLDHSGDAANVMAPWVQVADLSSADRTTARLLYELPPGRVRR
jgi:hypothetical protein